MVGGCWRIVGPLVLLVSLAACQQDRDLSPTGDSRAELDVAADDDVGHCHALRDRLCAEFGTDSDECQMAREQVKSFSASRCSVMLTRYDETANAAARFVEGQRALVSPEQNTGHGPAPSIGLPGAPITMVLFGDFASPACARGAPIASAIRNLHQDEVRLVFRQFPLSGNEHSHLAAEASLAAHAQGKFWRFYEVLFGNEIRHDREALKRYAKVAELDLVTFEAALDSHEFAADVDADRDLGKKVNVSELPALFVNGERVSFPYGAAELDDVIADARKALDRPPETAR